MDDIKIIDRAIARLEDASELVVDGRAKNVVESALADMYNIMSIIIEERDMRLYDEANERALTGAHA